MPKVKDEYLAEKRMFILECTGEVLKEKPLYLITMRDIIQKARFSQGAIYQYYANLDEIYVDFINKHTIDSNLEQKIDTLLSSKQPERIILAECLVSIGEYIAELLKSGVGKAFFELLILYSSDPNKRAAIIPRIKFKQSLEYAQYKTVEYTLSCVEKGILRPSIPLHSLIAFVGVFIDGVSQRVVFSETGVRDSDIGLAADIPEMFQTLAKTVIGYLEV